MSLISLLSRPPALAARWRPRQQRQQRYGRRPTSAAAAIAIAIIIVVPMEDGVPRAGGAGGPQNIVRVDAGLPATGRRGGRDPLRESRAPATASRHCCWLFSSESGLVGRRGRGGLGTLETVRCGAERPRGGREDEGREELVGVGGAGWGAYRPLAVPAGVESRQLR